jgi:hypothetical protein
MYCRVLTCDFDGTTAVNGRLAPEVAAVLAEARARGFTTLLVTGRVLEQLEEAGVDVAGFDAIVAENGAVVWLPHLQRTLQLGEPPADHFLRELRARGVPFHVGSVVIGTWDRHAAELLDLIRQCGIDAQLAFNRAAVMLLPSGVNKAVGTQRALDELGRSVHNMIAFGDAENDGPLLARAEIGVAVRGAVPALAAAADERAAHPGSEGVARYIRGVLAAQGVMPTPPRHRVVLGEDAAGKPVLLPGSGTNVLISGDPRSGKSWLAGLLVEQLLERDYRVCVIDPEGDHLSFGQRPQVMVLGHDLPLPTAEALPRAVRDEGRSLVVNLAALGHGEKQQYVQTALAALEAGRVATGLPQWIVIDEAHYFFYEGAPNCRLVENQTGTVALVTYRPSLIASIVHAQMAAHIITNTEIEEERYFVTGLLQARGPHGVRAAEALAALGARRAGLLLETAEDPRWEVFTPSARRTAHAHHARKYADDRLPEDKAFYFLCQNAPGPVAHNVAEFCAGVQAVPRASLRHHLLAGDFSRWVQDVLGDETLAGRLRKLERTVQAGAPARPEEIVHHLKDRYLI